MLYMKIEVKTYCAFRRASFSSRSASSVLRDSTSGAVNKTWQQQFHQLLHSWNHTKNKLIKYRLFPTFSWPGTHGNLLILNRLNMDAAVLNFLRAHTPLPDYSNTEQHNQPHKNQFKTFPFIFPKLLYISKKSNMHIPQNLIFDV